MSDKASMPLDLRQLLIFGSDPNTAVKLKLEEGSFTLSRHDIDHNAVKDAGGIVTHSEFNAKIFAILNDELKTALKTTRDIINVDAALAALSQQQDQQAQPANHSVTFRLDAEKTRTLQELAKAIQQQQPEQPTALGPANATRPPAP